MALLWSRFPNTHASLQLGRLYSRSLTRHTAFSLTLCKSNLDDQISLEPSRMYSSMQAHAGSRGLQRLDTLVLQIQDPGPNPQKVGIILEELGLPSTVTTIENKGQDSNQNEDRQSGGAPPVKDKNTGMIILNDPNSKVTLWESLAIVEYLIQTYDNDEKLHYTPKSQNWWLGQQWLAYQMGAQSPFFSLKVWFSNQHDDKVPSVIQRFSDDVVRIASIMEHYLEQSSSGYLVGDKCTYADLVFVPWNNKIEEVMGKEEAARILQKYPRYRNWHQSLMDRPAVQRIMQNNDISSQ